MRPRRRSTRTSSARTRPRCCGPKTGLKDMFIELNPGTKDAPLAEEGWTIPVANTLPDVNPDEFLAALDADTRDYLKLLLSGAGEGLEGRGDDLREVLGASSRPTATSRAVNERGRQAARASCAGSINSLAASSTRSSGARTTTSPQLVDASSRVFRRARVRARATSSATVRELPSALRAGDDDARQRRAARRRARAGGRRAAPGGRARCARANERDAAVRARGRRRCCASDIRPFVREARPLVRDLRPAAAGPRRRRARPDALVPRAQPLLQHARPTTRTAARGRTRPTATRATSSTWPGSSTRSTTCSRSQDAHGPCRPITLGGTCATLAEHRSAAAAGARGAARPHRRADRPGASAAASTGARRAAEATLMQKQAPTARPDPRRWSLFALSCFGLLLFLWLAFGGPIPLKPKGYRVAGRVPRGHAARRRRPTCASPACRSARSRQASRPGAEPRRWRRSRSSASYAPIRARRARDAARQDAARRDVRRDDARLASARRRSPRAALLDTRNVERRPSSSTRSSTRSTRTRARRSGPGSRASAEAVDGPRATTSTTRSATCPAFVETGGDLFEVLDEQQRRAAARSCATPAWCSAR